MPTGNHSLPNWASCASIEYPPSYQEFLISRRGTLSPFRIRSNAGGQMPVTNSRSSPGTTHFPFFAARRSRLDFGFGPFAGRSDANPPAFGAMPQHLPVVEYFIPLRL